MDDPLTRKRHEWADQIIHNLELEGMEDATFQRFNDQRLKYLAKRSAELVQDLNRMKLHPNTSLEFKAKRQLKLMKESLVTMIN